MHPSLYKVLGGVSVSRRSAAERCAHAPCRIMHGGEHAAFAATRFRGASFVQRASQQRCWQPASSVRRGKSSTAATASSKRRLDADVRERSLGGIFFV